MFPGAAGQPSVASSSSIERPRSRGNTTHPLIVTPPSQTLVKPGQQGKYNYVARSTFTSVRLIIVLAKKMLLPWFFFNAKANTCSSFFYYEEKWSQLSTCLLKAIHFALLIFRFLIALKTNFVAFINSQRQPLKRLLFRHLGALLFCNSKNLNCIGGAVFF